MVSLGFLQLKTDGHDEYIHKVAIASASKHFSVYRFSPFDYDVKRNRVNGLKFDCKTNEWRNECFPLPKYIYDRTAFSHHPIDYKRLIHFRISKIEEQTTFLNSNLPCKWYVYQKLKDSTLIKPFLPHTEIVTFHTLKLFLNQYKKVVLKPNIGSGGNGIYVIENKKHFYSIRNGEMTQEYIIDKSINDLYNYVKDHILSKTYLIQPFLSIQKNDYPFDLRIVVQKKATNCWDIIGKGYRKGKKKSLLSNLHAGGEVCVNMKLPRKTRKYIDPVVENIIPHIPQLLEDRNNRFFELGIDLGIDIYGDIWLLEVNSKPGYKTVLEFTDNKDDHIFSGLKNMINHIETSSLS
ncbi:YheC/YheD family protein [Evansella cellulosilytica]|uniref:ATP-grasp domain-containing protein n=1 Tax=Evansella cellulosilytica (strain ATCC 21833 / DSM 2522 / FERM P-1141 / JCM 9156 / N-4) TaxID=649639 RepID=E6TUF5_EVAC2|nr:YheC/YheD family protein [Evansella cellulosilytica]ADU29711.1 hypothetical protein Bcell_1448 [Evansella cellulosilytica DSM 2522]